MLVNPREQSVKCRCDLFRSDVAVPARDDESLDARKRKASEAFDDFDCLYGIVTTGKFYIM